MRTQRAAAGVVMVISLLGVGCSSGQRAIALDEGRAYPSEKAQIEVLNIQMIRDMATVSLTNTSARSFERAVLWVNQEYSLEIPRWEVGQTLRLDLGDFRNRYGEGFRAGGFFAVERPKNLVLAQLETPDNPQSLLGLVVVEGVAVR